MAQIAASEKKGCSSYSIYDLIHGAAFYSDSSLGQSTLYPEGYSDLSTENIKGYFSSLAAGSRSSVIGVNVKHDVLVKYAEQVSSFFGKNAPATSPVAYVGGEVRVRTHGASDANVGVGFSTGGFSGVSDAALGVLGLLVKGEGSADFNNYSGICL